MKVLDGIYVFVNGKKEEIRINNKKVSALNSKNDDYERSK